jgi:uncharacterized protein
VEIDTVLVKVASRCNINCSYCYVYNMGDEGWRDMPALISQKTIESLCQSLALLCLDQATPFATVLHGGEPLMLGERRLDYLLSSLRAVLPATHQLCVQTNGTLITDSILDLFERYNVAVSVSIDGPKPINDRFRVGHKGETTFDKLIAGIQRLRSHRGTKELFAGLLAVIDPLSDPSVVYWFLKGLGAPSIDFLYRDGNHTNLPFGKESFHSTEYGAWLAELFDTYLADSTPIRVRVLDDMMKIAIGGRGAKEGVGQTSYGIAVVETDGTISKNDTLKSTFDGADKFSKTWDVANARLSTIANSADFVEYHSMQKARSAECIRCPDLALCGGGMPLHRWSKKTGFDNPSVYCNDQKLLIGTVKRRLLKEGLIS